MLIALDEARRAADRGEVPVGAVIVSPDGTIMARAGNRTRELADPTAHAEMLVIREACRALGSERLIGFSLYVTLDPCPMCAAAISFARIQRVYYEREYKLHTIADLLAYTGVRLEQVSVTKQNCGTPP